MSRATLARAAFGSVGLLGLAMVGGPALAVDRTLGATAVKPVIGGAPWTTAAKAAVASDIDALLDAAPTLRGAHVGLLAIDSRSGDMLYARNPDDAFEPASTLKLITGSVALDLLGPHFRFHTEAFVGSDRTLYVKAGGDPLLTGADIAAMARAAVPAGAFRKPFAVAVYAGDFASDPYPPGWSWDDFVYDYAPQLSPLPVDENALQLRVLPGPEVGAPPLISSAATLLGALPTPAPIPVFGRCPDDGSVAFTVPPATTGALGTPVTLDLIAYPAAKCFEVIGSLPFDGEPQTLGAAQVEPAAYLDALVERVAVDAARPTGIADRPVPADARSVWVHDGEPLSDLLADMWLPSDNFVAEMLLRAVGLHTAGAPGTTAGGVAAERRWLRRIGVDPSTLALADGSGLSAYDRITPRALVATLQADWNGPNHDLVLDDLPVAGLRGTLKDSFVGTLAQGRTFAKTGTLRHARGLAGYLATLHHGAVTFGWSVDDWLGSGNDLAALRARVLSRLIGD